MQATLRMAPEREALEAGGAVGMHPAAEAGEMVSGMLPFPVVRERY